MDLHRENEKQKNNLENGKNKGNKYRYKSVQVKDSGIRIK